ncbi:MAG TPA: F0F1 ATP synthase subunit A [Polyangiaceae bacterium]|nr:F0F1 ATP synthase subunit A [Polyangiaceae bacterium]
MPEHTTFFSYLLAQFPALAENMHLFGKSLFGESVGMHGAEALLASIVMMVLVLGIALGIRGQVVNYDESVIPDAKLSWRTFFEVFVGYWYDTMKDMMGPKRAKRYFPLVGSLACFILFSNALGLVPGFAPPTSNWNITLGCALIVFLMFNYYGLKENGVHYLTHLFGPYIGWWGIPINLLLFIIEVVSTLIRPLTLSIRLMLNMAVDHLLVTLTLGMVALFLPVPVMVLSTLVVIVQVMVFCLLTSIYISLATEHDEAEADAKGHGVGAAHAAGAGF